MNSFYSENELKEMGFKSIGKNVLLSKKASYYGNGNIVIGDNVRVDDFCVLSGKITIGNYIHISAFAALYGGTAGICVNDFSSISSRVTIYAVNDDYLGEGMANPMLPDKYRKVYNAPVLIEKHVLIGSGSIVLPGVTLREGSSFGAMSLVNKSSEQWSVNYGVPCKKMKDRSKHIQLLEQQFLAEMKDCDPNI